MRAVTERQLARALGADERREVQKKLDEVNETLERLRVVLEDVQAMLTPCYGEKGGERCYLPDHHRGDHMSPEGSEWRDDE